MNLTLDEAQHIFEGKVVRHCAPALAGVKASNLFNCCSLGRQPFSDSEHHGAIVERCRLKMGAGGVALSILARRCTGTLVFVYRPQALRDILQHEPSRRYLQARGYDTSTPEACIEFLQGRLAEFDCGRAGEPDCERCEFPHEIGLLLGYPFEDVMGFIAHGGRGSSCIGTWKVYGNEEAAQSAFACYAHHKRVFGELFSRGTSIEELALLGQKAQAQVS